MTYVLLQNFLKIAPRNVLKIRFIASTSPGDEGRGRKVRYRLLFRAGPWCRSYLEPCETRVPGEGRAGGEKMERGTRDVVLGGKDARESFPGKSGHVPALSDAANLLERSSLEKSHFLRHVAFRFSLSFLLFLLFLFSTTFLFVDVMNSSISSFPIFFLFGIIFMTKVLDRYGKFCIRCLEFFTSMELNK